MTLKEHLELSGKIYEAYMKAVAIIVENVINRFNGKPYSAFVEAVREAVGDLCEVEVNYIIEEGMDNGGGLILIPKYDILFGTFDVETVRECFRKYHCIDIIVRCDNGIMSIDAQASTMSLEAAYNKAEENKEGVERILASLDEERLNMELDGK